jgi:hypothetical protein
MILHEISGLQMRRRLRRDRDYGGTSMIGKSQGETEIPLDSVEWVLRAGG